MLSAKHMTTGADRIYKRGYMGFCSRVFTGVVREAL